MTNNQCIWSRGQNELARHKLFTWRAWLKSIACSCRTVVTHICVHIELWTVKAEYLRIKLRDGVLICLRTFPFYLGSWCPMFTSAQHARCNSHGLSMHLASVLFVVVVRKQMYDIRIKGRWMANIAQITILSWCVCYMSCASSTRYIFCLTTSCTGFWI